MKRMYSTAAALGLCVLGAASCAQKRDTALVLWIETDFLPADVRTVHLQIRTQDTPASIMFDKDFPRIGEGQTALPWSGSLVVAPAGRVPERVHIAITLTPTLGNGTPFTVEADAPFARNEWRQLEMFLARQCSLESVRNRCATAAGGAPMTCGSSDPSNPCIPIRRENLPLYDRDAGIPDVAAPTALDVPTGIDVDASIDASIDVQADVQNDVSTDTFVGRTSVQAWWPPYSARVTGGLPRFKAFIPINADQAIVQYCARLSGANCAVLPTTITLALNNGIGTGTPSNPLSPGHGYWRVLARVLGVNIGAPSAWRPLFVGNAAPVLSGVAHPVTGIVTDLDDDGFADAVHSISGFETFHQSNETNSKIGVFWSSANPLGDTFTTDVARGLIVGRGSTSLASVGNAHNTGEFSVFLGDVANNRVLRFEFAPGRGGATSDVIDAPVGVGGFGLAQAPGGDINGDGFSDLVVGSNGAGAVPTAGAIAIYWGGANTPSGLSAMPTVVQAPAELVATARFGSAVSSVCDYNSDGYSDVVVGAGNAAIPGFALGAVYVYFGSATFSSNAPVAQRFTQNIANDYGNSVACAGDIDNDGFVELVIGGTGGAGQFDVFNSHEVGALTRAFSPVVAPMGSNEQLGRTVAGGGDVDGDGFDDILIGAPTGVPPGAMASQNFGFIKIYYGGPLMFTLVFSDGFLTTATPGGLFGQSAAFVGPRMDGGTHDSFLVGAPLGAFSGISLSGAAFHFTATDRRSLARGLPHVGLSPQQGVGAALVRMN